MEEILTEYDSSKWRDCEEYWIYDEEQRTPGWLLVRRGRASGSTFAACIGDSNFDTPEEQASYSSGRVEKEFTEKQLEAMNFGTITEDEAREWYEKSYQVKVEEKGMVVPKWNMNLGVSVDGVVFNLNGNEGEGIIEIKCPKRMYWNLKQYSSLENKPNDFDHIFKSHYAQMQLGMAVWKKK